MATDVGTSNLDLIKQNTNPSQSQIAADKLNSDFTFFLKMLTTQLQNQDPTEPMDVSQMTQQIATYSGVEQQVRTNSNLEKLLSQQKQSQLSTAVSYIGKEVEMDGNTGTLQYSQDGTQKGAAKFNYTLPEGVSAVEVTLKNASGEVVYTGSGPVKEGKNDISWNGVNSSTRQPMDPGMYSIEVVAKDASGVPMSGVTTNGTARLEYTATTYAQATFSYTLAEEAKKVEVTVTNAAGQAVFQSQGPLEKGRNVVVWDGMNSFNGEKMPAGKYSITVKATKEDGSAITTKTHAVGIVNTVETDTDGTIKVTVGDVVVPFDKITAVREATPAVET